MKDHDTLPDTTTPRLPYTYHDLLHSCLLVRHLPNAQWQVIRRVRMRSDADGHRRGLQRLMPEADLEVVFRSARLG